MTEQGEHSCSEMGALESDEAAFFHQNRSEERRVGKDGFWGWGGGV